MLHIPVDCQTLSVSHVPSSRFFARLASCLDVLQCDMWGPQQASGQKWADAANAGLGPFAALHCCLPQCRNLPLSNSCGGRARAALLMMHTGAHSRASAEEAEAHMEGVVVLAGLQHRQKALQRGLSTARRVSEPERFWGSIGRRFGTHVEGVAALAGLHRRRELPLVDGGVCPLVRLAARDLQDGRRTHDGAVAAHVHKSDCSRGRVCRSSALLQGPCGRAAVKHRVGL